MDLKGFGGEGLFIQYDFFPPPQKKRGNKRTNPQALRKGNLKLLLLFLTTMALKILRILKMGCKNEALCKIRRYITVIIIASSSRVLKNILSVHSKKQSDLSLLSANPLICFMMKI